MATSEKGKARAEQLFYQLFGTADESLLTAGPARSAPDAARTAKAGQLRSSSRRARRIAGDLDRTGQTIGMADPIIAAIALEHNLELVTGNFAHFQRIIRLGYPLTLITRR